VCDVVHKYESTQTIHIPTDIRCSIIGHCCGSDLSTIVAPQQRLRNSREAEEAIVDSLIDLAKVYAYNVPWKDRK